MSTDEQLASRRVPRQGVGGSPVGSALTIVLAIVAVVAGFLILQELTEDGGSAASDIPSQSGDSASGDGGIDPDISVAVTEPTLPEPVATEPARVLTGATVLVANANTVGGSAGQMTSALEFEGYTVADPVNASGANIGPSIVYYAESVAGAQAVAETVALDLGGVDVLTLPTPPPVADGDVGDAGVVVLLGDDQAGQTIADLRVEAPADAGAPAAPEPSAGDAPADETTDTQPAGDDEAVVEE